MSSTPSSTVGVAITIAPYAEVNLAAIRFALRCLRLKMASSFARGATPTSASST